MRERNFNRMLSFVDTEGIGQYLSLVQKVQYRKRRSYFVVAFLVLCTKAVTESAL